MRTPRRLRAPQATSPQQALNPSQFRVNQAWLVVKANDAPFLVEEVLCDVYVLQDAASMYLFGNVFVPCGTTAASQEETAQLFSRAWGEKQAWPAKLLLPNSIAYESSFVVVARLNGLPVEVLPESAFAVYAEDVQTAFKEHFGGESAA